MNPIHRCIQKISPGNHFSYIRDGTYVRMYRRTDKGDAICPPPIINGGGIKKGQQTQTPIANFIGHRIIHTLKNCPDMKHVSVFLYMLNIAVFQVYKDKQKKVNHMLDDIKYTKFLLVNSMNFFTCFYHTVQWQL